MFIVKDDNNIRYVGPGPVTALDSGQVQVGDMVLSRRIMAYVPEMKMPDEDHGPLVVLQGDDVIDDETRQLMEKHVTETAAADKGSARPQIVVVSAAPSDKGEALSLLDLAQGEREATCREGASVTLTAELRDGKSAIMPANETYRVPVRARDGREFVVRATFADGTANIVIPFASSGVWEITEAAINSTLPAGSHVSFAGFTVYAVT